MNKIEILNLSKEVATFYSNKGYTKGMFSEIKKEDIIKDFSALEVLKEIPKSNYDKYVKIHSEESTLNYFKSLVSFEIVYLSILDSKVNN